MRISPARTGLLLLVTALLIGAALRVPGWFTQEEMERYRLFETDEEQHIAIALHRYNAISEPADTVKHQFKTSGYNVRGFGHLMGLTLKASGLPAENDTVFGSVLLVGRSLSTLFALLLIVVVYGIGRVSGLSPPAAGVAAILLAVADLNATYSHYAVPAVSYVFWCYLALLGGLLLTRKAGLPALLLLAVGAAGAATFKFDVFPTLWGGMLLLVLAFRGRKDGIPAWYVPLGIALLAGTALLMTWGWTWEEIVASFQRLRRENADVVASDHHFRDNLITYPAAVLAGIGLPAFALAAYGAVRLVRERWGTGWWSGTNPALVYAAGFLLTEAFLRYYMDTTFVRRANIFLPAVALLAAWSLHRLRARPWVTVLVIGWSCGLAVVGQNNHWNDPRYAFRDWAREELQPPVRVGITGYLNVRGLDNWKYYKHEPFDYFVAHETMIRKFRKSLTTPFGIPECCDGIYHCGDVDQCHDFQAILEGRRDDLVLVKTFRAKDYFPERLLYRHFFGYYETFLGDVEVYKRTAPQRGERTTS